MGCGIAAKWHLSAEEAAAAWNLALSRASADREAELVAVLAMVRQRCALYLEQLDFKTTGRDPKLNGYAYAKVPEWALRQTIERLDAALSPQEQDDGR